VFLSAIRIHVLYLTRGLYLKAVKASSAIVLFRRHGGLADNRAFTDYSGMNLIRIYIEQQGFVVLDGALATELERHGADLDDPLWSARCLIESPELISRVHMDYMQAGADVLTSATYQASLQGFQARGFGVDQATALLRQGVELALAARDDFWSEKENRAGRLKPLVAASMGPFGACLHDGSEYHGNYSASWAEVEAFHRSRLDVLANCGADLLAFETIPSLPEAELLLQLLADYPGKHAWLSFSCRDEAHVSHGELFRDCAEIAGQHEQVAAVGINCTAPRYVTTLLNSVNDLQCPLLVYPNSGETWVANENCWIGEGIGRLDAADWFRAGARLIGGCCRTGPEDIAGIRAVLASMAG
jgi:homocysteine S-methyltransferase